MTRFHGHHHSHSRHTNSHTYIHTEISTARCNRDLVRGNVDERSQDSEITRFQSHSRYRWQQTHNYTVSIDILKTIPTAMRWSSGMPPRKRRKMTAQPSQPRPPRVSAASTRFRPPNVHTRGHTASIIPRHTTCAATSGHTPAASHPKSVTPTQPQNTPKTARFQPTTPPAYDVLA